MTDWKQKRQAWSVYLFYFDQLFCIVITANVILFELHTYKEKNNFEIIFHFWGEQIKNTIVY